MSDWFTSYVFPWITLILGAGITLGVSTINDYRQAKREQKRDTEKNDFRLAEKGRGHASEALRRMRSIRATVNTSGAPFEINLSDLSADLDEIQYQIELIPNAPLRTDLTSALRALRYPTTLQNSAWTHGLAVDTQREASWLIVQALAAYIREEENHSADQLSDLVSDQEKADDEAEMLWRENRDDYNS